MRELPTNGCGSVFPNRGLVFSLIAEPARPTSHDEAYVGSLWSVPSIDTGVKETITLRFLCTATISFRSHSKTQHTVLIKDNNQTCETWLQCEITQRWTWLTGIWTTYMEENDNSSLQEEVRVRSDRYINLPPCSYSITAEVTNFAINAAVRSIKLVSTSILNAI